MEKENNFGFTHVGRRGHQPCEVTGDGYAKLLHSEKVVRLRHFRKDTPPKFKKDSEAYRQLLRHRLGEQAAPTTSLPPPSHQPSSEVSKETVSETPPSLQPGSFEGGEGDVNVVIADSLEQEEQAAPATCLTPPTLQPGSLESLPRVRTLLPLLHLWGPQPGE